MSAADRLHDPNVARGTTFMKLPSSLVHDWPSNKTAVDVIRVVSLKKVSCL